MWFEHVVTSEDLSAALNGKRLAEDVRLPRQKDALAATGAALTSGADPAGCVKRDREGPR